ncbi:UDP-N-acetylmuramate--L-alanine ligase [Candidatus Gracilibacteria bacterium GN02-872]|nr:UDP-N-acetylmuramate--L-alanine ligase [Candidatus Gracilibacteria bacterium GN02-872]
MDKKVYFIGIGGIGISALARYYNSIGYKVYGSDKVDSELIHNLKKENIDIIIGEDKNRIDNNLELIVFTEAIPENQEEYRQGKKLGIKTLSYPEALGRVVNSKKLISISGTHGKSTTTSMCGIMFKNTDKNFSSIIGTLLKEFGGKNFYHKQENKNDLEEYFIIEACEYRRSFLNYKPYISIMTNIEIDHLDYYKDEKDYIKAFRQYSENIKEGGYLIINGQEKNSRLLLNLRNDINYIEVFDEYFTYYGQKEYFPDIKLKIPGKHILYDAKLVYIVGKILKIEEKIIIDSLESYNGVWRRMEILGETNNGNLIISDYGHHPTEINLTLKAIKEKYVNKEIITIFQPHQYSRTLELLDDFGQCFLYTDKLIIPNIYESRDSQEVKNKINVDILLSKIEIQNKENGHGIENTFKRILELDKEKNKVFIIMGAGDIDNLRYNLHFKK